MANFRALFDGIELDLTKSNEALAKEWWVDDPKEFEEVRSLVKHGDVYITIDPFYVDVHDERLLIIGRTQEEVDEAYERAADDI